MSDLMMLYDYYMRQAEETQTSNMEISAHEYKMYMLLAKSVAREIEKRI